MTLSTQAGTLFPDLDYLCPEHKRAPQRLQFCTYGKPGETQSCPSWRRRIPSIYWPLDPKKVYQFVGSMSPDSKELSTHVPLLTELIREIHSRGWKQFYNALFSAILLLACRYIVQDAPCYNRDLGLGTSKLVPERVHFHVLYLYNSWAIHTAVHPRLYTYRQERELLGIKHCQIHCSERGRNRTWADSDSPSIASIC